MSHKGKIDDRKTVSWALWAAGATGAGALGMAIATRIRDWDMVVLNGLYTLTVVSAVALIAAIAARYSKRENAKTMKRAVAKMADEMQSEITLQMAALRQELRYTGIANQVETFLMNQNREEN